LAVHHVCTPIYPEDKAESRYQRPERRTADAGRTSTDCADHTDSCRSCQTGAADCTDSSDRGSPSSCPLDRLSCPPLVIRRSTTGNSSDDSSPRSSASWSRSYLQRDPGRNLDGIADCDSAGTLGRDLTRYAASNRTRISTRCSEGGGRSSGEGSRRSSPRRSLPSSSGRGFGGYVGSYWVGIGGVGKGIGTRVLGLGRLGPFP
jgi:hypothetical protein